MTTRRTAPRAAAAPAGGGLEGGAFSARGRRLDTTESTAQCAGTLQIARNQAIQTP